MTDETRQQMLKNALGWSMEIGCCPDKERFALRVWDLFDKLGISAPAKRRGDGTDESVPRTADHFV